MSAQEIAGAIAGGVTIGGAAMAVINAARKTPAEVENLQADASALNVQSALAIAKAESERADRAEAQVREHVAHIEALLGRVDTLQTQLHGLQTALSAVREELDAARSTATI